MEVNKKQGEEPEQNKQGKPEQAEDSEWSQLHDAQRQHLGTDPVPKITVLGRMDGQVALRLGWRKGMVAISLSRLRFLKEDLELDITDNPENYLF